MHKRIYLIVLTLMLVCVACTKELKIEPPANRQMVLNGEPYAGGRGFVNFAYTRFFLDDNNDQPVGDATLTLVANGVRYTPDSVSRCNYFFPYTINENDSLRIEVDLPDGRQVSAETWVPLLPDVEDVSVRFIKTVVFNVIDLHFKLNDHAALDEIYSITLRVRDSGERYNEWTNSIDSVDTIHSTYFCLPNNPEITSEDVTPYRALVGEPWMLYGQRIMFLDRRLAGRQNYDVELVIPIIKDTSERAPFKHEYFLEIHSLSVERFKYIIDVSSQGGGGSFFAEQGATYGNVDGALGIFAGAARVKYAFADDTIVPEQYRTTLPTDPQELYGVLKETPGMSHSVITGWNDGVRIRK